MTLVARYSLDGIPFLVGDILVSEQDSTKSQLSVPTIGSVSPVLSVPCRGAPSMLTQKLYIIGGNVAIGVSGAYGAIRALVRNLTDAVQTENFTRERLLRVTNDISKVMWENVGVVGSIIEAGVIHHFTVGDGIATGSGEHVKDIALAGSGRFEAASRLEDITSAELIADGEPKVMGRALSRCLMLTGLCLSEEIRTWDSLRELYGGAYEIVIPNGTAGFRKFDDVTYIFYHLSREESGRWVLSLIQVMKNFYIDDVLIVRTRPIPGMWSSGVKNSATYVRPIHRLDWEPPSEDWFEEHCSSFNSTYVCQYASCVSPPHHGNTTIHVSKGEVPVRFVIAEDRNLTIEFTPKISLLLRLLKDLVGDEVYLDISPKGSTLDEWR